DGDRGLERRQVFEVLPAVVEGDPRGRLVAAGGVRLRAATAPEIGIDGDLSVGGRVEVDRGWRDFCRSRPAAARKTDGRRRGVRRWASGGWRGTGHGNYLAEK